MKLGIGSRGRPELENTPLSLASPPESHFQAVFLKKIVRLFCLDYRMIRMHSHKHKQPLFVPAEAQLGIEPLRIAHLAAISRKRLNSGKPCFFPVACISIDLNPLEWVFFVEGMSGKTPYHQHLPRSDREPSTSTKQRRESFIPENIPRPDDEREIIFPDILI